MTDCRIVTLYSGSDGNATYIRAAGTSILIDAGRSARALCRALAEIGASVEELEAIFITHEHRDHIAALEVLTKKRSIPIHIMAASAERIDRMPPCPLHDCLVRHDAMFCERVGGLSISSFRTPHDSRMSVGYRISFCDGTGCSHTLGYATDVGYVSDAVREGLLGCEAVVLESNHDVNMLMEGPYPYDLKQRILSRRGHLSNADSAALAAELALSGTHGFLLAHVSRENNDPTLVLDEAVCAISDPSVTVAVAAADEPTELILS